MLTQKDLTQLQDKNISQQQIETQLNYFKTGFPFLKIVSAASPEKGILKISGEDESKYLKAWDEYLTGDKKVTKFVPASGAASRMFKDLYSFIDAPYDVPTNEFEKTFFNNIRNFAFYDALNKACVEIYKSGIEELTANGDYKKVVEALLFSDGLNYGNLPKGLLLFHKYSEGNRTPVGEHLHEGTLYAKDKDGKVNIHFTVSQEHKELFELLVASRKSSYEKKLDAKFDVSYSVQKPSTDTIAVDMENNPFRN